MSGGPSDEVYAFVNGIEIVSMPTGLYHTKDSDPGARVVGNKYQFPIDKSIALKMVQRLNVGGRSIPSKDDTGMFREWSADSNYLLQSSVLPATTTSRIKYTEIPAYVAPQNVYQTSWSMDPGKQVYKPVNFTWKLPVDLGFRYLLRIHFCELEYEIKESGNMQFSIFFNEEVAETNADVMKWSGGNGVAVYRDYVVIMEGDRMEGKRDLLITLFPHREDNKDWSVQIDAILKGDGVTYCGEKIGEKDISLSPSEGLCRRFSLAEILSATNNFDDELVVGSGGFGKVYKAVIDGGATTVTIKRVNSKSKQGAGEFWTEIKMISNLRHTHLVSLIGYCDERPEMILVYEYMEYGTLADHLYKINTDCNGIICHLSWEQRLNICIGRGSGTGLPPYWYSTRATSRSHTHVSTDVKGTFGYFDPAYFQTRRLTKKSDMYAFGVVMLEVLCGRPAVDTRLDGEQHSLVLWAQHSMTDKKLDQIVHPSLREEISPKCLMMFAEVASKCLHSHPNERPTMADVVVSLECALASNHASDDQHSGSDTEEDNSVSEEIDEQIDDKTQPHNALRLATVPSPSTLAQHNENYHPKRGPMIPPVESLWDFGSTSGRLQRDNDTHLSRHFSLVEILVATNNFHESLEIGGGSFGKVYKGWINHGTLKVAIKRSTPFSKQGVHEFMTKIDLLLQLRHRHLVSLIGYCNEDCEMILIYEYMSCGTLSDYLHNSDNLPLSWKKRLEICIGAARGLHYLHALANRTIIHRDVKTANILLDDNWVAKVADFGLSKENWNNISNTHISTMVMGSFGYMDPEYFRWLQLTEKSDVYSFGVVLFEVLCARHPLDRTLGRHQINLAEWGRFSYENGTLDQIIDANLKGEIAAECLKKYGETAVNCLRDEGIAWPSMGDVLWDLEQKTTSDKTQRGWDTTESMDHDLSRFNNEDYEMVVSGGHMLSDGVTMRNNSGTSTINSTYVESTIGGMEPSYRHHSPGDKEGRSGEPCLYPGLMANTREKVASMRKLREKPSPGDRQERDHRGYDHNPVHPNRPPVYEDESSGDETYAHKVFGGRRDQGGRGHRGRGQGNDDQGGLPSPQSQPVINSGSQTKAVTTGSTTRQGGNPNPYAKASGDKCYRCGEFGHRSNTCSKRATTKPSGASTRGRRRWR
ncbi:malectin/receptor-like protein kinase family protein [Actinidia rufa]|uniref:Malectin/receptor-like protein kinase family protein n=1 Tax=Actinidia rufa TaxID=165716 RepID=A0A7J0D9P4_9ERIC|nr:malectin/receptor-like protein kinase family protein [Actinidia rufa]